VNTTNFGTKEEKNLLFGCISHLVYLNNEQRDSPLCNLERWDLNLFDNVNGK
jgi:hypothetical protein